VLEQYASIRPQRVARCASADDVVAAIASADGHSPGGGAYNPVAPDAAAFTHRDARFGLEIASGCSHPLRLRS
jgi:hypothetical protein